MKIRVGFEMIYDFPQPTPLITVLGTHFARASDDRQGRDACGVEDGRHDVDHVRWARPAPPTAMRRPGPHPPERDQVPIGDIDRAVNSLPAHR